MVIGLFLFFSLRVLSSTEGISVFFFLKCNIFESDVTHQHTRECILKAHPNTSTVPLVGKNDMGFCSFLLFAHLEEEKPDKIEKAA